MNERIKELALQASVWCDENIPEQFSEETNGYGSAWEEKFAALVEAAARADEREACAKLCDNRVEELYASRDTVDCAEWLSNEIRARGRA